MTALVLDGNQRPALAITRSLGRRGIVVLAGEDGTGSLASSSRYCGRPITYPSPFRHPAQFDQWLLEFVARERPNIVIPVTDITTDAVSFHQEALRRHTAVAVPPSDAFRFVSDKRRLLERAAAKGIPVPRTISVEGLAGLDAVIDGVDYPAVIKPTRSRIPTEKEWLGTTVHYADSRSELLRLYRETDYLTSHPSLVQERIVGPGVGLFVLFDRGRLVTAFAHRRLREKPPSGGVSVLRESIGVDPQWIEHAIRLLGPLEWHGVAMLEYKLDRRTGTAVLMEVNGRFWGSLQLAIDAGLDFPDLSYQLALGGRRRVPTAYQVGVKSRWLLGDLDHLLIRVFHKSSDLCLPPGAPSRFRTLINFLNFVDRDLRYEVIRRDDFRPFLFEALEYTKDLSSSAARKARRWMAGPDPRQIRNTTRDPRERGEHVSALR